MSYPPHRPSSTPNGHSPSNGNGNGNPSGSSHPSQHSNSPIDWAHYMNFSTPPVTNAGPAGNGVRGPMNYSGGHQGQQGGIGGEDDESGGGGDSLSAFAQAIAISRQSERPMGFQHPYQHQRQPPPPPPPPQQPSRPSAYPPNPPPRQLQPAPQHPMPSHSPQHQNGQSPNGGGAHPRAHGHGHARKGKSPAGPLPTQSLTAAPDPAVDNGLALDPAAFSRDIRFQVPSFLSTQMGGAPTFPPGGEAWSGVSGANLFMGDPSAGMTQSLTPGQMFSQVFNLGMTHDGGDRNGMGGYGDASWDAWAGEQKPSGASNAAMSSVLGPFSYVNPNPASNTLTQSQSGNGGNGNGHGNGHGNGSGNPSSPRANAQALQSPRTTTVFSPTGPHDSRTSSMSSSNTASLLPQNHNFPSSSGTQFPYVPSLSTRTNAQSASTINIASSSTAPYAPPSNTQQLLSAPIAPPFVGPSLTEGPGLYSTTGFDMVGVLARVAGRKDPKTVLGPVDLSCSFAVVDVRRYDCPIVYASPTFTALTGYELPQVLGRNCRFLQSPEGEVVKGSKRKYTDNVAVAHLKRMLNAGKECQASLINYRRGGIPFINLVTVVPIPWDGTDIVYHVGFQIDLVEQPNAILRNMRDGSYQVNYTVANPPQPPLRPAGRELGGTGLSQDVLEIMGSKVNAAAFAQGEDGPKLEWLKTVLENADDFIHVLSLKGLFQYVSPSVRRVLEYEPEDLLNKNISDICHPSDIVPLMRELKDSTHAPTEGQSARPVNLVFRIRRKNSGYVWIECSGRLHVEPGKGRKAVILSGRARSVPVLQWEAVAQHGGLAETEFWSKVSFEGLILHATSTAEELLGQPADDVIGQSIFSLLPGGDNGPPSPDADPSSPVAKVAAAFRTAVSGTGTSSPVSVQHKMVQKSGTQIDVVTIFYPPKSSTDLHLRSGSSSPTSEVSRPSSTMSTGDSGIKPISLVVQVKLLPPNTVLEGGTTPEFIAGITKARPLAHEGHTNLFEELETTRGTSWQYELHQLRVTNRRIQEQIDTARKEASKSGNKSKLARKRKVGEEMGPPGGVPEQYNAAPRHQLAPGFGLVTPGMPSPYY